MNLILLHSPAPLQSLNPSHPAFSHLQNVIHISPNQLIFVGLINGPRGKAKILNASPSSISLHILWDSPPPHPPPISLLIGISRPQVTKNLIQDLTSLGIQHFHFFLSDNSDPGYLQSSVWSPDSVQSLLINGAQQAFSTHLPSVSTYPSLNHALPHLPHSSSLIALDNYEAPLPLSSVLSSHSSSPHYTLAIGPERGFSPSERSTLKNALFHFAHLGPRILKVHTASIAATSLLLAHLKIS